MDFGLTDEQEALRDLARRMFVEHGTPERLTALEAEDWLDRDLWRALADAGLIGLCLPESAGGSAMSLLELHLLLEEAGAAVAHVPLWESTLAALALAAHTSAPERVAAVAAGEQILTLALQEAGAAPHRPVTRAVADGELWRLSGEKILVPCAQLADALVVSATTDDGATGVFLVPADAVTLTASAPSTDVPHAQVTLDAAPGQAIGPVDSTVLPWLLERAVAGLASLQSGVCQAALRLAASYTGTREQFGRPIATFQAVSQRVADAYIEAECLRLTALQAAWRLAEGLPASDEVAIAKYWAGESGHRVLHACQHVHGGVGVDQEYPLFRYLMRAKQYEFALGTVADEVALIGAALAADPA